jgi:uncharacterized Ntn-hydrolase superfamily protein
MTSRALRFAAGAALAAAVLTAPRAARATYSIMGTDTRTRQVGGAGTSCVGGLDVHVLYGSAPGFGVVAAQASLDSQFRGRNEAIAELKQGISPDQIIQTITTTQIDPSPQSRQYGIVDLQGRAAGFTGSNTLSFADDRQGTSGTYTYSVQGNILTSGAVLDHAAAAFTTQGCDLADKLMLALEAGAQNGEGDSRCTTRYGTPSDSAFIEVDLEQGTAGSYLLLSNSGTAPQNPIELLRAEYDDWRQSHPCPSAGTGGSGGSGGSSGAGGTGGMSGSGGSGGSGALSGSGGVAASGGAGGSSTGGSGGTLGSNGGSASNEDSGCGCSVPGTRSGGSAAMLLALASVLLREHRSRQKRCARARAKRS